MILPAKIRSDNGLIKTIGQAMQTQIDLPKYLRQALNHLYNPEQLRKNPLVEWFGFSERYDAPSALQTALTDAIQALRPGQYEPMHSEARQTYEILLLRYIQQFNQQEVAHHIGVSERQFRREQDRAINVLADSIWKRFGPASALSQGTPAAARRRGTAARPRRGSEAVRQAQKRSAFPDRARR
jgi:predicted DNA-binding protein (UPF0251 family)